MIQTLCDTGPLLAIIDPKQGDSHRRCMEQLKLLQGKLLTTWPCVAEAMRLADNIGGRPLQRALWHLLRTAVFDIAMTEKARGDRMDELMDRYQTFRWILPMHHFLFRQRTPGPGAFLRSIMIFAFIVLTTGDSLK